MWTLFLSPFLSSLLCHVQQRAQVCYKWTFKKLPPRATAKVIHLLLSSLLHHLHVSLPLMLLDGNRTANWMAKSVLQLNYNWKSNQRNASSPPLLLLLGLAFLRLPLVHSFSVRQLFSQCTWATADMKDAQKKMKKHFHLWEKSLRYISPDSLALLLLRLLFLLLLCTLSLVNQLSNQSTSSASHNLLHFIRLAKEIKR